MSLDRIHPFLWVTMAGLGCSGDSITEPPSVASVTISASETVLRSPGTIQLTASVRDKEGIEWRGSVTWSSSDPTIASVTSGLVRGVTWGTVAVTASAGGVTSAPLSMTILAPISADSSVVLVDDGIVGDSVRILVEVRDATGLSVSEGGGIAFATVSGTNPKEFGFENRADGTKLAAYVPPLPGFDTVTVTLDGSLIGGSPSRITIRAAGFGTANVDGLVEPDEWAEATSFEVFTNDIAAQLYVMNDDQYLYLALVSSDESIDDGDRWVARFDDDLDRVITEGDEVLWMDGGAGYSDRHCHMQAQWNCVFGDQFEHGSGVRAAGHWEMRHPLRTGDPEDFDLQVGDAIGMCTQYADKGYSRSSLSFPRDCVLLMYEQTRFFEVLVAGAG